MFIYKQNEPVALLGWDVSRYCSKAGCRMHPSEAESIMCIIILSLTQCSALEVKCCSRCVKGMKMIEEKKEEPAGFERQG